MVNGQIADLANLMKTKKADGEKFVLMLGAGASMGAGVPSTPAIMQQLVDKYGSAMEGRNTEERFDKLWRASSDDDRRLFLKPYLDLAPSSGFGKLAELIDAGFIDIVVTFNFDTLVEQALRRIESLEFKSIIRGETADDQMQRLVDSREPRVKVAKLHGSLRSSDHFLFAAEEMHRYPEPIEAMLRQVTGKDIIVCGYAFNDTCVIRAFAEQGGLVISVDPGGVPAKLRYFTKNRRSDARAIEEKFDPFFEALHAQLLAPKPVAAVAAPGPAAVNPFKFLESYEPEDEGRLLGRDRDVIDCLAALAGPPVPHVVVLGGAGRAGKSSLVKAALMPALEKAGHHVVYLRCRADLEVSLPRDLAHYLAGGAVAAPAADIPGALKQLVASRPDGRFLVLLDQFDRLTGRFDIETRAGLDDLGTFMKDHFFAWHDDRLTVVLVVSDDGMLGGQVREMCGRAGVPAGLIQILPFSRAEVESIVRDLAAKAAITLDEYVVKDLAQKYEESRSRNTAPEKRFTLAHVQAICHLLVSAGRTDADSYRTFSRSIEALHQAINVCDIISFVEDFAWSEAAQLRNLIKVPLLESKERIAEFVKAHYQELLAQAAAVRRTPAGPRP